MISHSFSNTVDFRKTGILNNNLRNEGNILSRNKARCQNIKSKGDQNENAGLKFGIPKFGAKTERKI